MLLSTQRDQFFRRVSQTTVAASESKEFFGAHWSGRTGFIRKFPTHWVYTPKKKSKKTHTSSHDDSIHIKSSTCFSPDSDSYRGSYFQYGGGRRTLADWTWHQGAIPGCSGRGAIAGPCSQDAGWHLGRWRLKLQWPERDSTKSVDSLASERPTDPGFEEKQIGMVNHGLEDHWIS